MANYILPVATETTLGGVKIGEGIDITQDGVISIKDYNTISNSLEVLGNDVLQGKTLVANAITGKGVETSPTDSFQQMSENISNIPSSGGPITESIAVVQKTTKMKSIKLNVIDKETAKQLADILHMKIHWIDDTSFVLNLEDDAQNGLLFNISTGCYDLYQNNSKYTPSTGYFKSVYSSWFNTNYGVDDCYLFYNVSSDCCIFGFGVSDEIKYADLISGYTRYDNVTVREGNAYYMMYRNADRNYTSGLACGLVFITDVGDDYLSIYKTSDTAYLNYTYNYIKYGSYVNTTKSKSQLVRFKNIYPCDYYKWGIVSPSYPETYNDIVIEGDPNQYKFLSTERSSSAVGKCIMALVKLS